MSQLIQNISMEIWNTTLELAPWLLFGSAISGVLYKLMPPNFIRQQLQGYSGVFKSVLLGIPLPLCSCGVIPAGMSLKENGSSTGSTIGFLIATPQTGIDSILVSASFLGWPFALFKVLAALITGLIGGWLGETFQDDTAITCAMDTQEQGRSWKDALMHSLELIQTIWKWLLFGIVFSAVINYFIPTDHFSDLTTWGTLGATLGALFISVPLYVCATASVPIAAALVQSGFPLSAALVFLMAGPATNIATIGTVRQQLGLGNTIIYLGTVIVGSVVLGLGFDFLLVESVTVSSHHHHESSLISIFCALTLYGLMCYFFQEDIKMWFQKSQKSDAPKQEFHVEGMSCGGCSGKLQKALNAHPKIEKAEVLLESKKAIVHSSLTGPEIKAIISETGFTPSDIA